MNKESSKDFKNKSTGFWLNKSGILDDSKQHLGRSINFEKSGKVLLSESDDADLDPKLKLN